MGRESLCHCVWNGHSAEAKALLESAELILRGGIRRRIPFTEMHKIIATGSELSFCVYHEQVTLRFPTTIAEAWAKRILSPAVSLATKLGIRENSTVLLCNGATAEELQSAVGTARIAPWSSCSLAIAEVTTEQELNSVLDAATKQLGSGVPLWVVYRKGPEQIVNETVVRKTARARGWIDNKVVSISIAWTGLRFGRAVVPS